MNSAIFHKNEKSGEMFPRLIVDDQVEQIDRKSGEGEGLVEIFVLHQKCSQGHQGGQETEGNGISDINRFPEQQGKAYIQQEKNQEKLIKGPAVIFKISCQVSIF